MKWHPAECAGTRWNACGQSSWTLEGRCDMEQGVIPCCTVYSVQARLVALIRVTSGCALCHGAIHATVSVCTPNTPLSDQRIGLSRNCPISINATSSSIVISLSRFPMSTDYTCTPVYHYGALPPLCSSCFCVAVVYEQTGMVTFLRFRSLSKRPQKGSTPPYCLCVSGILHVQAVQGSGLTLSTAHRKPQSRSNVCHWRWPGRRKYPGKLPVSLRGCPEYAQVSSLCRLATEASPCGLPAPEFASAAVRLSVGHPVSAINVAGLLVASAAISTLFHSKNCHVHAAASLIARAPKYG